jgi:integrase
MSKTLTEAALSTQNARKGLVEGLHWRGINADVHLGYRKQRRGGKWLVRWYKGGQKYAQQTIGTADDGNVAADGAGCLNFEQAKAKAAKVVSQRRAEAIASSEGPVPTVRMAIDAYVGTQDARDLSQRGEKGLRGDARLRLSRHVLSKPIAQIALHELLESDLSNWRAAMPSELAQSTVRRIVNDFRAALNAAAVKNRTRLPPEVVIIIKNGLATDGAEAPTPRDKSALPDTDIRRIVEAAAEVDEARGYGGDLLRIVLVLSATGARFSQVVRMAVGDVQIAQNRLMVPTSRKGRGTKRASHIALRVGADVMSKLRPAITGRRAHEPLLERWRHRQVQATEGKPQHWIRDTRGPWHFASELSRPWREIVTRAGLPVEVVPYALRHSSIVRQLRTGLPVRLVAALHDTSNRMIESHYSAAIIDALDELSAGAIIPLVSPGKEKIFASRAL